MSAADSKDLFVLAADLELKNALDGLLSRATDLGVRDMSYDIERHPNRDSGCRSEAVEYSKCGCGAIRRQPAACWAGTTGTPPCVDGSEHANCGNRVSQSRQNRRGRCRT